MPKYSVKKPFTILVAVILVLVLGFVSLTGIQTDLLPAMNLPYLMVITTYPGASPEQVEADVTKPLENALSTLNGVKNVTSQSNENYSLLFLEYQDDTDMDSAMVKASTAVNQLGDTLPDMASTPTLIEISPDMMATQYVAVDCEGMDIYELSDYINDTILPQLERVDGVASVSTTGLVKQTVQITGEVVGDIIDARDGMVWVTLSEASNSSNASVAVLMTRESASHIDTLGRYGATGTMLQVRGVFHLACPEDQGLSDVHATSVAVVAKGIHHANEFRPEAFAAGAALTAVGFALMGLFRYLRERQR